MPGLPSGFPEARQVERLLRIVCFLACIPSGGALLLKVWGIAQMPVGGAIFLACIPVLLLAYAWACRRDLDLERDLRLGFWGGLAGTIGYDVVRIPFLWAGFKVFAPIQAYGVWLLDAGQSSGLTESIGWLYHFTNGITFGIMYALVMAGRHWAWGLLWGLALEAIVLSTPFARIFHMQGNWSAIVLAYAAHLAYGFPLGYIVAVRPVHDRRLAWGVVVGVCCFVLAWIPAQRSRDARASTGGLRVEGRELNPTWLRLRSPGAVQVVNPGAEKVVVLQPSGKRELELEAGAERSWNFDQSGIYQCYIRTTGRSVSSFIIVDPVEQP